MALYIGGKTPTEIYKSNELVKAMCLGKNVVYNLSRLVLGYDLKKVNDEEYTKSLSDTKTVGIRNKCNCVVVKVHTYSKNDNISKYSANFSIKLYATINGIETVVGTKGKNIEISENITAVNTEEVVFDIPKNATSLKVATTAKITVANKSVNYEVHEKIYIYEEYRFEEQDNEDTTTAMLGKAVVGNMVLGEGE